MPEILSQSQIDELLSEMSSGEIDNDKMVVAGNSKKVKEYDFRSPKKLTKEQIKTLFGVYENFARHLASYFSGILRTYCEISVASVEEQPYFEYNNALPDSILIGIMDAKPIEGPVLVDISNSITFSLIERLLGGSGDAAALSREFTEIEIILMERIFNQMASFMGTVWSHYLNIDAVIKNIETNARLIRTIAMDEVVAIIIMDVSIKSVKGTITFCIPCINLETIIDQLNQNQVTLKRKIDSTMESLIKETMLSKIRGSAIEVRSIFGETILTMGEVLNLQVGDVIKLDQRVDSNIKVLIEDKIWFHGIPGVRKNKKAVKINEVL